MIQCKITNMKVIFLFIFYSHHQLLALDTNEEGDKAYQALKNNQIEKMIFDTAQFKNCKQDKIQDIKLISDCFKKQIEEMSDINIEKISNELQLKKSSFLPSTSKKDLSKYFQTVIEESLYQERIQDKKIKDIPSIDIKAFTEIYESIISKNLLLEVSSFCLEHYNRSAQETKEQRYQQLVSNQKLFRNEYNNCLASIKNSCINLQNIKNSKEENQACILENRLREYRKILVEIKNNKNFYDELKKSNPTFHDLGLKKANLTDIDKKLTLSSSEIIKKGYKQEEKKLDTSYQNFYQECLLNKSENCNKLAHQNEKEALEANIIERKLLSEIYFKKLDDASKKSANEFKQWLIEDGSMTTKEIEEALKDPIAIKELIQQRYLKQEQAIIDEIQEKIKKSALSKNDDQESKDKKYNQLSEELKNKELNLKLVLSFNNIASSFLNLEKQSDSKNSENNSLGLEIEAKDLKNSDNENEKNISDYLRQYKKNSSSSNNSRTYISIETLDKILDP